MSSRPRPILKIPASPTLTASTPLPFPSSGLHRVHFPPTPTMTQIEITHSSFTYDRKPIVVLPNACALPARGERAMDPEHDLELRAYRKKQEARCTYEPVTSDASAADGEPEQSSLFARDPSSLSASYRVQNDTTLYDSHPRNKQQSRSSSRPPMQTFGTLDPSDTACNPSAANFLIGPIDACHFIQNISHMDLSLAFMQPKHQNTAPTTKRSTARRLSDAANHFELTRKVVGSAGCGGFNSGRFDSGLDGCLGGF